MAILAQIANILDHSAFALTFPGTSSVGGPTDSDPVSIAFSNFDNIQQRLRSFDVK